MWKQKHSRCKSVVSCEFLKISCFFFKCSVDRASWYNLRQCPTWYTLALFYNTFITILYIFRALYAHHQEVEWYWCSIWYLHSHSVAVRCTGWERTKFWDDTRCCNNTIQPPDDEHFMIIIRRLNCFDAASGIVTLIQWPFGAQVERKRSFETIPDAASVQFNLLMMSI